MKKEELKKKPWYRLLRVIFYGLALISLVIGFYLAKSSANESVSILDEQKTYEALGQKIRTINPNEDTWNTSKYPSIESSTNQELGKAFYQNRFTDQFFYNTWINKKGDYEFFINKDTYSVWGKLRIYAQSLGGIILGFAIIRLIGLYVLTGKGPND